MNNPPKVSCLCVTQIGRKTLFNEAVACFHAQDYPNKELVVINDEHAGETLGELRNRSLRAATGDYLAQWDDDDLSHPSRLSVQVSEMQKDESQASFLERVTLKCVCGFEHPSHYRSSPWENTMVIKRDVVENLSFPHLVRGEDTVFVGEALKAMKKYSLIAAPLLYVYRYHGGNTWHAAHWDEMFWLAGCEHKPSGCMAGGVGRS